MDCIICQDSGTEKLQENTSCPCKYKCHPSCWVDYVHSKTKITCPLCRKDITIKSPPKPTAPPYAPPSPQEIGQQISYQEFVDIIRQYNSEQHTIIEIRPQVQTQQPQQPVVAQTTSHKIFKIIIGLGFVVIMIVVLSVYLR